MSLLQQQQQGLLQLCYMFYFCKQGLHLGVLTAAAQPERCGGD